MKPEPDDLRSVLETWRELPPCDPGLGERVLRDVAGKAKGREMRGLSLRLAVAVVVAGVTGGVVVAEWRARHRDTVEMPQRYLAWIDPLPPSPRGQP